MNGPVDLSVHILIVSSHCKCCREDASAVAYFLECRVRKSADPVVESAIQHGAASENIGDEPMRPTLRRPREHEQILWFFNGKYAEHHRVDRGENRSIGADAQGETQDDGERHSRSPAKLSDRVSSVSEYLFDQAHGSGSRLTHTAM